MLTNISLLILFSVNALIEYLFIFYHLQLKGYRFDRISDLFTTEQGRLVIKKLHLPIKILPVFILSFLPESYLLLTSGIFLLIDLGFKIFYIQKKQYKYPKFTVKTSSLILISLFIDYLIGAISFYNLSQRFFLVSLFVILATQLLIALLIILFFYLPNRLIIWTYMMRARYKIKSHKNLIVIGITGSYGKTTTKEFLAHILSKKYSVAKTAGNLNSDIGIAKSILTADFDNSQIFIMEIGAYKVGHIKYACKFFQPTIGILTAINEEHLSLFGSMENIQAAKYELLRAIPETSFLVTNSDNFYCREKLIDLKAEVITFGKNPNFNPTIRIENVSMDTAGLLCHYKFGGIDYEIKTPIHGIHNVYNLAASIAVALRLGLSWHDIQGQCVTMPEAPRLRILRYGNTTVIDDTYNSNPDGFRAALQLLSSFENKRKIIITRGMIELGDRSLVLHEKIANDIGRVADEIVVITPDFLEPIKKGLTDQKTILKFLPKTDEILNYIRSKKDNNDVILLENRLSPEIMSEIVLNNKKNV